MYCKIAPNIVTSSRVALPKIPTSVTIRHLWTPGNEAVAKITEAGFVTKTSVHIQRRVHCVLFGWQTPLTKCDHRNTPWTCLLYIVHDRVCGRAVYTYYFDLWFILFYAFRNQYAIPADLHFLTDSAPRISPFLANFRLQILCILLATRIKSLSSERSFTPHFSTSRPESYETKIGVRTPKQAQYKHRRRILHISTSESWVKCVHKIMKCYWTHTQSRTYEKKIGTAPN